MKIQHSGVTVFNTQCRTVRFLETKAGLVFTKETPLAAGVGLMCLQLNIYGLIAAYLYVQRARLALWLLTSIPYN